MPYDVTGKVPITLALLGALPASAMPQFTGDPADVAVARAAWSAAEVCTGRPGLAKAEVEIVHRTIPGGYLGVAHTDPDGHLIRIDLNTEPERHREVLVHEVAHAWVSQGPLGLVEGVAELLSDCMVAHTPGLATLQFDDGRDLTGLVDLRTWEAPGAHRTESLGAIRTDAYVGAARLMRSAALVLEDGALWPEGGLTWPRLMAMLEDAGEPGNQVLTALRGGASAQRKALADRDLDGVPAVAEAILGTRDDRFDTDGDGWWDGAVAGRAPAGAVAVPLDGSPVCSGWAAERATAVQVYAGGNLRGQNPPRVVPRPGTADERWQPQTQKGRWGTTEGTMEARSSVLLQLDGAPRLATGAPWARVQGDHLVPDRGCLSTLEATVWAHEPKLSTVVAPLASEVLKAVELATEAFGPAPSRVGVALGGPRTLVVGPVVWLSTADVVDAATNGKLRSLAFTAVAVHHLHTRGERDWRAGEAMARRLLAEP